MATTSIGWVKSQKGNSYEVRYDAATHEVYVVICGGTTYVGKASSAGEAMTKAEAFVYNKWIYYQANNPNPRTQKPKQKNDRKKMERTKNKCKLVNFSKKCM